MEDPPVQLGARVGVDENTGIPKSSSLTSSDYLEKKRPVLYVTS